MDAQIKNLFENLKKKQFAPFYLIDGEETFYIDLITSYFEESILQPAEKDFNLLVLYGKDTHWSEVISTCRRFPMFAERQVVIVKDAAQMKDINELSLYFENPAPSTVLLIEYRFKKADGKTRLVRLSKEKGCYLTSEKVKEELMPDWIRRHGAEMGFEIEERVAELLSAYLGNDLKKIVNELEKIRINVPDEKVLSGDLIQRYIGISRDYNVFEFPVAFSSGNKDRLYRMLSYFLSNPKAAPLPLVIASFYNHLNSVYQVHSMRGKSDREIGSTLKLFGERLKDTMTAARRLSPEKTENCLLVLAECSLMSVGVHGSWDDPSVLKELIGRLETVTEA